MQGLAFVIGAVLLVAVVTLAQNTDGGDSNYQRTIVYLQKSTRDDEHLFFLGGKFGCDQDDNCPINIRHRDLSDVAEHTEARDAWAVNDTKLDWSGVEPNQGKWKGAIAEGSPGLRTRTDMSSSVYADLMTGDNGHWWMLDVDMDCSQTSENGEFEIQGQYYYMGEDAIHYDPGQNCETQTEDTTYHVAICGKENRFYWNMAECHINDIGGTENY